MEGQREVQQQWFIGEGTMMPDQSGFAGQDGTTISTIQSQGLTYPSQQPNTSGIYTSREITGYQTTNPIATHQTTSYSGVASMNTASNFEGQPVSSLTTSIDASGVVSYHIPISSSVGAHNISGYQGQELSSQRTAAIGIKGDLLNRPSPTIRNSKTGTSAHQVTDNFSSDAVKSNLQNLLQNLGSRLESLKTHQIKLTHHRGNLTQALGELQLEPIFPPQKVRGVIEHSQHFQETSDIIINECADYLNTAKNHAMFCKDLSGKNLLLDCQEIPQQKGGPLNDIPESQPSTSSEMHTVHDTIIPQMEYVEAQLEAPDDERMMRPTVQKTEPLSDHDYESADATQDAYDEITDEEYVPETAKKKKGKPFNTCPICQKTFKLRKLFNRHWTTVHQDAGPLPGSSPKKTKKEAKVIYKCMICEKSFKWERSLKRHLQTHEDGNEKVPKVEEENSKGDTTKKTVVATEN